jgi:hypothetical protein
LSEDPPQKPAKRCVCGQSKRYPICDESHEEFGWRCDAQSAADASRVFAATIHLRNFAERLAHRFDGVALHRIDGPIRSPQLVVLSDGHGHGPLQASLDRVSYDDILAINVGLPAGGLQAAFPEARTVSIAEQTAAKPLWVAVENAVKHGGFDPTPIHGLPSVFLSHAVADEPVLLPVISALRDHFGVSVFSCADSIDSGTAWKAEVEEQLRRAETVLFISSEAANRSVFCAFEIGMALARNKDLRIVTLAGSLPPSYIQDIQANDVERLLRRKPWLGPTDGLMEACLHALAPRPKAPT